MNIFKSTIAVCKGEIMAIIGIDLGTTNSLVSYWKDGELKLLKGNDGSNMFASAVCFMKDGILVGNEAKERYYQNQSNTVTSFKCSMGSDKIYKIDGKTYTPTVLSSMVLKLLKDSIEEELGEEIEEAVITVPAYFNDKQRSDTKKAAILAGLNVERLINEPSAAALYYMTNKYSGQNGGINTNNVDNDNVNTNNIDADNINTNSIDTNNINIKKIDIQDDIIQMEDTNLLVFDFGGGTLDLSYVECFENIVEIVAVAGNNHLGGDDIDKCIMEYLCGEKGMVSSGELLKQIRTAKENMNEGSVMHINGVDITEDKLFEICLSLFKKIKEVVIRVLEDAEVPISEVDDFILVGGSSNLAIVQRFLRELTGKTPFKMADCDEVVALGAGLYAGIRGRQEKIRDIIMTDVCPFTLGTNCVYGKDDKREYLLPVIKRNSTLPCTVTKRLNTVYDFQTELKIGIYQGEQYYADENLFLGDISINVNPKPAGKAYADISFTYDINGILKVDVKNEEGIQKNILIKNQMLSEYEIEKYQEEMDKILSETNPWTREDMQAMSHELEEIYANCSEGEREIVGAYIAYFERVSESGRVKRIRKMYEQTKEFIEQYRMQQEIKEDYIFDLRTALEEDEE